MQLSHLLTDRYEPQDDVLKTNPAPKSVHRWGNRMNQKLSEFTVLIERRTCSPQRQPKSTPFTVLIERRSLHKAVSALVALTMAVGGLTAPSLAIGAPARDGSEHKLADDLLEAVDQGRVGHKRWSREHRGQSMVEVIFVANAGDDDMADLQNEITRAGGTVTAVFAGMRMISATLPAKRVKRVARRADVEYVTPNRETTSTASHLEQATGALGNVRTNSTRTSYTGPDGSGVAIAVLDSGVMRTHKAFETPTGTSRVIKSVTMLKTALTDWTSTTAYALQPGTDAFKSYDKAIDNAGATVPDVWGHGTHVAAIAAGRPATYAYAPDTTGMAPNANIVDVKVLGDNGRGTVSDTLEGIQWVITQHKNYNIRVINLSLAAQARESWKNDPLCIAVRSAAAMGITVVAAAGNYGAINGQQVYGNVMSPGNDPSVITVGSAMTRDSHVRSDDAINTFSSRGPTRSGERNATTGVVQYDHMLKPDLVAPGNRVLAAAATSASATLPVWNQLAKDYVALTQSLTFTQAYRETQMYLSGTSVAAPVVAGAAAVLLHANPGLTPPMIKAILQYTAQPLPGANLLQQGAGLLNLQGAVSLAKALRTDVQNGVWTGAMTAGTSMLAKGVAALPARQSTVNGETFNWSRMVFLGGNRVVTGDALFTKFQPIYDPRVTWAKKDVFKIGPTFWDANNVYTKNFVAMPKPATLLTAGVVDGTALLGSSSATNRTGLFTLSTSLMDMFAGGQGFTLSTGIVVSEGIVISEGFVLSEGLVLSEGIVVSEGIVISEGFVISEGIVVSESNSGSRKNKPLVGER